MPWREQTSGGLPDPEPWGKEARQLQQDILDELSDHLDCALSQELRETTDGNEASAHVRVLDKFGNPQKLARSLWLAAMKEQVMSNRIMMGTNIVLAIAVLAICVFTISAMNRNNEITEALLARLETFTTAPTPTPDTLPELASVTLRISTGDPDISPERFQLQLNGYPYSSEVRESITEYSDDQGLVTFSSIRAGAYSLATKSPQGEVNSQRLRLNPGDQSEIEIIYHKPEYKTNHVSFKMNMPSDIQGYLFYTLIELHSGVFESEGHPNSRWHSRDSIDMLIRSDGMAVKMADDADLYAYQDSNTLIIDPTSFAFTEAIELDTAKQYNLYVKTIYLPAELYVGPLSDASSADPHAAASFGRINNRIPSMLQRDKKVDFQSPDSQSLKSLTVKVALSETLLSEMRLRIRNDKASKKRQSQSQKQNY